MIRTKSNTIFPGNSPKISKATKNGNAPFTDLACLGKYEAQFPGQNSIYWNQHDGGNTPEAAKRCLLAV